MAKPVGFVGRERELSRLEGALAGDPRLVLVVGDAGIGKTRFAGEGMRRAAASGMVCVFGGCLPLAGELPLLPVADALGELNRLAGGELVEDALNRVPRYVRTEVARLLPGLETAEPVRAGRAGGWQRDRLFSAVAELLDAVAGESGFVAVIEDVHWADGATLDCLTYLARAGGSGALTLVVTCRGDEVPLDAQVTGWLAHARGAGGVEEIRLGPLSRAETAQQIAGLVGEKPPRRFADDLYVRAEGNPFFAEQLVAAALAGQGGDTLLPPSGLPERLADLLLARVSHAGEDARAVLAALAVAGRALTEDMLTAIAGLGVDAVRGAVQELAAARLLAAGEGYRPRHALLGEAVAAGLLPGERAALHERTALVLDSTGDGTLAAEAAGHWAAAGRADKELPARLAAAAAAEHVYGYAEAAAHWQRAIELCRAVPEASQASIDLPRLYLRVIRALENSGNSERAGELAEEAYGRFASHTDPATAAVIHQWAGFFRGTRTPAAGLPLIKEALRLFEQAPPSADQAEAWLIYGNVFLLHAEGQQEAGLAALNRAVEIAESVGATAVTSQILSVLALHTLVCGEVEEGFALLRRGRALAGASGDSETALWQACHETSSLNLMAEFDKASEAALAGLQAARNTGRQTSNDAAVLASSGCDAMLARGHTADAAALIDPLIDGPPDLDNWPVHLSRAEIDLLRGDIRRRRRAAAANHSPYPTYQQHHCCLRNCAAGRGAGPVGAPPRRRPHTGSAGARSLHRPAPDDLLRAAAGGGHGGLCRPGRAGQCPPRQPPDFGGRGCRQGTGLLGRPDGWYPVHRPSVRGSHPSGAGHLERRANPPWRCQRPRRLARGRENLARPGLPAPGRLRMVAGRRGAAGRSPAPSSGCRPAPGCIRSS